MENKLFSTLLLTTIMFMLSILMILGIPVNGYAGAPEPPSPGEIITGPEIVGTLTLIHSGDPDDYSVKAIFYGFCRGLPYPLKEKFCSWPIFVPFTKMRTSDLKNYRIYSAGPDDCRSECGEEDLMIVQVNKFERRTAKKIVAEVVIKYIVPEDE
jgi:hypothetical protein